VCLPVKLSGPARAPQSSWPLMEERIPKNKKTKKVLLPCAVQTHLHSAVHDSRNKAMAHKTKDDSQVACEMTPSPRPNTSSSSNGPSEWFLPYFVLRLQPAAGIASTAFSIDEKHGALVDLMGKAGRVDWRLLRVPPNDVTPSNPTQPAIQKI